MHLDDQLKFDFHIEKLCKNANRKLHALARVTPYMDLSKKRISMNAFFDSQFNYNPLTWMCHSRKLNHKINRLHWHTKKYFLKGVKSLTTDLTYFWVAEFKNDIRFALSHQVFEIWVIPIFILFWYFLGKKWNSPHFLTQEKMFVLKTSSITISNTVWMLKIF